MTTFTELHRLLGRQPGELTTEMIDDAVAQGLEENGDLDWKAKLPDAKNLQQQDFVKDVAAMANTGGGVIVFGVKESNRAATERCDVGELTEAHSQALVSVAVTGISPPVFGLEVVKLGTETRAVVVIVPASVDGPHLIYRNDYFGAPMRNGPDTVWMKERQIEAAYRARFDEQRRSDEVVESLYADALAGRDTAERAWLVAVACPRIPGHLARPSKPEARATLQKAASIALGFSDNNAVHPLDGVDTLNPRPGLRRWVAPNTNVSETSRWREAWVETHHDGSVSVAAAVGGHKSGSGTWYKGNQFESRAVEAAVADFMGIVRATAESLRHNEYDVLIGIEWLGAEPLRMLTFDRWSVIDEDRAAELLKFIPVRTSLDASASDIGFHHRIRELAEDCVNQGGITELITIKDLPAEEN